MLTGERQAWELLTKLNPGDVCDRAGVMFDESTGKYTAESFLQEIFISPESKEIFGHSPAGKFILDKLEQYSRLSILWYLIKAKDIPLSGKLIKPADLQGGQIYVSGSHVLPLDKLAGKYGGNISGFLERGRQYGGEKLNYGDASLRLFPFPRVPILIILWKSDAEFSSRASLLLDSTCEVHLPSDIIWSTAMMSVLLML